MIRDLQKHEIFIVLIVSTFLLQTTLFIRANLAQITPSIHELADLFPSSI